VWTKNGIYIDTIINVAGCDSIIVLEICFNTTSSYERSIEYYFYISPSGKRWTKRGVFTDTIDNRAGCDSIISISLTLKNGEFTSELFKEYVYPNPGNGTFNFRIHNPNSIDQLIIYNDLGQVTRRFQIPPPPEGNWQTETFDLSDLVIGVYYWELAYKENDSRKSGLGIRYKSNRKFIKN
jgi:hypothetical protein